MDKLQHKLPLSIAEMEKLEELLPSLLELGANRLPAEDKDFIGKITVRLGSAIATAKNYEQKYSDIRESF